MKNHLESVHEILEIDHKKKHYTVNNEKDLIYLKNQVKNKKIF